MREEAPLPTLPLLAIGVLSFAVAAVLGRGDGRVDVGQLVDVDVVVGQQVAVGAGAGGVGVVAVQVGWWPADGGRGAAAHRGAAASWRTASRACASAARS